MKKANVIQKNILAKLRSQDGVSMIISLGIFLVAVVISLSLISIGMTSAKMSSAQMEDEQAYLVVSSAMRVFEGEMENVAIEAVQPADADGNFPNVSGVDKPFDGATFVSEMGIEDALDKALIELIGGAESTSVKIFSPTEATEEGQMMLLYDTTVKLTLEPGATEAEKYIIRAKFSAKPKDGAEISSPAEFTEFAYYYPYMGETIEYGTKDVGGELVTIPVSRTTTIKWKLYAK